MGRYARNLKPASGKMVVIVKCKYNQFDILQ